jgi:hypothetical protein
LRCGQMRDPLELVLGWALRDAGGDVLERLLIVGEHRLAGFAAVRFAAGLAAAVFVAVALAAAGLAVAAFAGVVFAAAVLAGVGLAAVVFARAGFAVVVFAAAGFLAPGVVVLVAAVRACGIVTPYFSKLGGW